MKIFLKQKWVRVIIALSVSVLGVFFLITTEQNKADLASVAEDPTPEEIKAFIKEECKQLVAGQREEARLVLNNNETALKILELLPEAS